MSKISEIISKQVVSLYEAKFVGTIVNVVFDERLSKLKSFIVIDENDDKELELSIKDVFSFNDSFVIKNQDKLKDVIFEAESNNPINKIAITIHGEVLGKILDIELNEDKVLNIILDNGKLINPEQVVACENVLILNDGENKVKRAGFSPRVKKVDTENIVVRIQENNVENENQQNILKSVQSKPVQLVPPRFVAKTLLGQISLRTVKGLNNEIIVKKGEQITNKVLERAKLHNVLNQLV